MYPRGFKGVNPPWGLRGLTLREVKGVDPPGGVKGVNPHNHDNHNNHKFSIWFFFNYIRCNITLASVLGSWQTSWGHKAAL